MHGDVLGDEYALQHQRLRGTGGERRGAAGGAAADGGRGDGGVQDVLLGLAGGGTGVRRDGCGRNRLGGKIGSMLMGAYASTPEYTCTPSRRMSE